MAKRKSDIEAFFAGSGATAWRLLGAHPASRGGAPGYRFAVWAPHAQSVAVIGDFNGWQPDPLQRSDGLWTGFVAGGRAGQRYKFQIRTVDGQLQDKADPFAFQAEVRPDTASVLAPRSRYRWRDSQWLAERPVRQSRQSPLSVYELHLGSWRRRDGQPLGYREIAQPLVEHVRRLGFTHVELLPLAEYPYDPSWGYQVTGYFAPTSRYGSPDDLRFLIDTLHVAGIGVLLDWVPAHFPRDGHGLGRFDGTPLFEDPNPLRGEHPDWGTWVFDYGRNEVRSFLLASAHYWLSELHVDGLRVDAVASMLYLDYSRPAGRWQPNVHGGNIHLEAQQLLCDLNELVHSQFAGAITIAEESTAYDGVTRSRAEGGLGFTYKWNMGWMHDTLKYFREDPIHRRWHHDTITFASLYWSSEAFMLPLSHDEVVHLKKALVRKMGGHWDHGVAQLRLLYGYQWTWPGKKLLFMGGELGQTKEWDFDRELQWELMTDPTRQGLMAWLASLNGLYVSRRALHAADASPSGFEWVDGSNAAESVLVFCRQAEDDKVLIVLHFTPTMRPQQWLPVPAGRWRFVVSSDLQQFGGFSEQLPQEPIESFEHDARHYITCDLPGYAVLVLEPA